MMNTNIFNPMHRVTTQAQPWSRGFGRGKNITANHRVREGWDS